MTRYAYQELSNGTDAQVAAAEESGGPKVAVCALRKGPKGGHDWWPIIVDFKPQLQCVACGDRIGWLW